MNIIPGVEQDNSNKGDQKTLGFKLKPNDQHRSLAASVQGAMKWKGPETYAWSLTQKEEAPNSSCELFPHVI